jgi:hypothetical protein
MKITLSIKAAPKHIAFCDINKIEIKYKKE